MPFHRVLATTLIVASLSVVAAAVPSQTEPFRVTTPGGDVVGSTDGTVAVFKGIPYAKPPVGVLRWRPPQPPDRWTAPRDATAFGAVCVQRTPIETVDGRMAVPSEDCLTVNVWAPAKPASPSPVMVWIHGGANTKGAGAGRYYDGTAFARDGIVLVSFNYRLGFLGFFAHRALTAESASGEPLGTFALMDQLAALRWVKANISAFGGDPSNVTIFGESAGGTDVLDLMTLPEAAGLFQRAVAESAGFFPFSMSLARAEAEGARVAAAAGLGAAATAGQLRAIPAADLLKVTDEIDGPIVDGRLMTASPVEQFAAGHFLHVPLVIGANSDEGSLLDSPGAKTSALAGFSDQERAAARAAGGGVLDDEALADALFRDLNFVAPSRWVAERSSTSAPTYLYRFSYLRLNQRGHVAGASHGAEIPYVFDSWPQAPGGGRLLPAADRAEAAHLHHCWIDFARTGVPTCDPATGWPAWPTYDPTSDHVMDFGVTTTVRPTPDRAVLTLLERRFVPAAHGGSPDSRR